jgi:hypothetical protein
MRFQIPQFIEVESKIFGPLTFKQFIYLAGGAGIIFIFYTTLPFWLMIIFAVPVASFSFTLAFYKVHSQPFIKVLENAFNYFVSCKVYIWKKQELKKEKAETKKEEVAQEIYMPKLTKSKLKDLAWSLNIKEMK